MQKQIAVIGESMIETKPGNESRSRTFGAALSDWLLDQRREEGIGCDPVHREPGALPGLYLIENA